ncbi:hypothetical protein D8674_019231 [Pyrus ussuriensis x Pyrus communis]|uniref:Uncharacterized protein n=1 Tax=Pyrus ussuriensis x Pyrus communis TaxID=2448454 RepID=A0A5N5G711_9ROSA|nr:hypothetical protein D8674_019231 [Pyrus ussuriensis x Pyrus communis]
MEGPATSGLQAAVEDYYLKRTAEDEGLEFTLSPHKKLKDSESRAVKKRRMAKRMRGISLGKRCLMAECAIYVEDEFDDLPVEYQDMWELLKEEYMAERVALLA